MCPADAAVQSTVAEGDAVAGHFDRERAAAFLAVLSPHLENIGKVGAKFDHKSHLRRMRTIVMEAETLIERLVPQNFRAKDMHGATRDEHVVAAKDVSVHEINREERVVVLDRGAEKKRAIFFKSEAEPRKEPGVSIIDSVLAASEAFDIAEAIKDGKSIALFQDSHPIVDPL